MYKFHRCKIAPRFPDLQDWRIEIRPDDPDLLMEVHLGVVASYFARFGNDPHLKDNPYYHWIKLGAQWLQTAEHLLWEGPIFVNINGGIIPSSMIISCEVIESDLFIWPERFEDEIITISRWPEGKHFYLVSNKHRIFIPDKHNNYEDAYKQAMYFVSEDKIKGNC